MLSRYLGGYHLGLNANKAILLERQAIIHFFRKGLGVYSLRCEYYLTYVPYGLACGIIDPNLLSAYRKKHLLRIARPMVLLPKKMNSCKCSK